MSYQKVVTHLDVRLKLLGHVTKAAIKKSEIIC